METHEFLHGPAAIAAVQARARNQETILPTDAKARKNAPIARGLLDYFPLACAAVAELSRIGNEQHNPGEPMHWAREKSNDHADCIARHLIDRGKLDGDGVMHDVKCAWRALAMAELALEEAQINADEAELQRRLRGKT